LQLFTNIPVHMTARIPNANLSLIKYKYTSTKKINKERMPDSSTH